CAIMEHGNLQHWTVHRKCRITVIEIKAASEILSFRTYQSPVASQATPNHTLVISNRKARGGRGDSNLVGIRKVQCELEDPNVLSCARHGRCLLPRSNTSAATMQK